MLFHEVMRYTVSWPGVVTSQGFFWLPGDLTSITRFPEVTAHGKEIIQRVTFPTSYCVH